MTFAVVFPGQGSQSVGMLADLAESHAIIRHTFQEAADTLGRDLWSVSRSGPADLLSDTVVTQPLMFTSGVAIWRVLKQAGMPTPVALAGHSLGEFAALVAAGSLTFAEGLRLVQTRAELMAAAIPDGEGAMAAVIGMDDDDVVALCRSVTGERIIEAVNFNAPGQVAISGHKDALNRVVELVRDRGRCKVMPLAVSVPNHSSLMREAGSKLAQLIDTLSFEPPSLPLLQNATAEAAADMAQMLDYLKAHVYSPVYWTRTIRNLRNNYEVDTLLEAGPGKVLCGLSRRIDKTLNAFPVDTTESLEMALGVLSKNQQGG